MKNIFPITIAVLLVLIFVFRNKLNAFFNPGPLEGAPCTDSNGNPSIIQGGACKEVVINPPANTSERSSMPDILTLRRTEKNCSLRVTVPEYPGVIWLLTHTNRFFCYYKRA